MRTSWLLLAALSSLSLVTGCGSDDDSTDDSDEEASGGTGLTAAGGLTSSGGANDSGGGSSSGGAPAAGGQDAAGGSSSDGGSTGELDCDAAMPSSGAQEHSGNGRGGSDNLAWEIWSNTGNGDMTTYDVPAFIASWNNAGGYLGRLGFEWGNSGKPYEEHGTITAHFVSKKSGTAGGYSYVGMYGWTNEPCVEWYIVDDSFNQMPINPGNTTNKGEVDIDGGTYIMYTRDTTGTGGSRCSGTSNWIQYYSVRKTARECGQISLTQHFDAWKGLGMDMGDLLEAKILVEVGGGQGKVELPVAIVTATQ